MNDAHPRWRARRRPQSAVGHRVRSVSFGAPTERPDRVGALGLVFSVFFAAAAGSLVTPAWRRAGLAALGVVCALYAVPIAGTGDGRGRIGALAVDVKGWRCTVAGTETLAGSVIALDTAVRNVVAAGIPLPDAVAAASRNPLELLGIGDRGRLATGLRADLVELNEDLAVLRVMRGGTWVVDD